MDINININDISETAFLTLQCHAIDAMSARPILNDQSSVGTLDILKNYFKKSGNQLHKNLFQNRIRKSLVTHTVLRAKKYDQLILEYIESHPQCTVVNIGCGLDHRFERVRRPGIHFIDLDLPDIMNIKQQLFPAEDHYAQFSQSVFEPDWIEKIKTRDIILVAEGVFMYCRESDVRKLFETLQLKLEGPEIVFEVFNSKWLTGWRKKVMEFKLKKELKLGEETTFIFGIPDSDAVESWQPGFRFIDDWSYLDSDQFDSSFIKFFRNMDFIRKVQWTVHYKLEK